MALKIEQNYKWSFFKAGGIFQANISRGADIANIGSLDKKLWTALACPVEGVVFDKKTLRILDSDSDGRIRSPEVVAACEWTCSMLKNPDLLLKSSPSLALSEIDDSSAEGAVLLQSAKEVLKDLEKPDAREICVGDFADETAIFKGTPFNADGVITELSAGSDALLKSAIAVIQKVCGSVKDRSGLDGIDAEKIEAFFSALDAYEAWRARLDADKDAILPFGADTEAFDAAMSAVEQKIEDYFTRREIVSYEPSSGEFANPSKDAVASLLSKDVCPESGELAMLPIAKISESESLLLSSGVNPAYRAKIDAFRFGILSAQTGQSDVLTLAQWAEIKAKLAPYRAWISSKSDLGISALSEGELAAAKTGGLKDMLLKLLELDAEVADAVANIHKVEKLVRFNRDLYRLLTNFVSFKGFYEHKGPSIFQYGTLFLDQRMCELCVKVDDAAKHASLSPYSYTYLVYCSCTRKGEAPFSIAAAVTSGDCDNLIVGRNGVFFDREGRDWDATITKIVSNPISVRQAFFSPYKRFAAWIGDMISKGAAAADDKAVSGITNSVSYPKAAGGEKKMDLGTLAAIGVAIGGITTAFGVVINALFSVGLMWLPLYILAGVLMISLPSMVMAAIKLHRRNLGPLLDANSWAVNTRAKLNFALGAALTKSASLPIGKGGICKKRSKGCAAILLCLIAAILAGAYFMWRGKASENSDVSAGQPAQAAQAGAGASAKAPGAQAASEAQAAKVSPAPDSAK
ncbi:MAG: hypothetical protein J6P03_04635 [Opitutales bacterium]|nr:hypothetical protein [Opitutales bacterium]